MGKRVLIRFRHGLGDATQCTIILKHLQYHHPDWVVDVESLWGKHSLFYGLCNRSYIEKEYPATAKYDSVFNLKWNEPGNGDRWKDAPLTKVTLCLRSELHLQPIPELYYYQVNIIPESEDLTKDYINGLPQQNKIVGIHYQGNTSYRSKNIDNGIVERLCKFLHSYGYIVVILDWDRRSSLPNANNIFCPGCGTDIWCRRGTGDGNTIAALINNFDLFLTIDSGPGHIAAATNTPTIVVWNNMHPLNFFDLSYNCTHLLRDNKHLRCANKEEAEEYFHNNYRYIHYEKLEETLRQKVAIDLGLVNS